MEKVLPNWQALSFLPKEETQDRLFLGLEDPVCTFVLKAGEKEVDRIAFGYPDPENPALRFCLQPEAGRGHEGLGNLYDQQFDLPASAFRDPFSSSRVMPAMKSFSKAPQDSPSLMMPTPPPGVLSIRPTCRRIRPCPDHVSEPGQPADHGLSRRTFSESSRSSFREAQPATHAGHPTGEALIQSLDLSQPGGWRIHVGEALDETTLYELPASKLMDLPNHPIKLRRQSLRVAPADLVEATIAIGGSARP